jgi:tRNA (guanosine-2'-O-)-methyltransferase
MTPERSKKIHAVLNKRQDNITVLLENVFDPHNISAVMRSCDAIGMQELYVLNTRLPPHKRWGPKSSSSAHKWLSIHQFTDANKCFEALRNKYQKILSTHLGEQSVLLYDIDFT